jgi:LPXTG-motif cell wall-anchored protein
MSIIRKVAAGAAAAVTAVILTAVAGGVPAGATDTHPSSPGTATENKVCKTTEVTHTTVDPYVNLGADGTTHTTGTMAVDPAGGVRIGTPDATSKVYGYFQLTPVRAMNAVFAAGFTNVRHGATGTVEPSYQFGLDSDGDGDWDATLAWEAVYQPGYTPAAPGAAKTFTVVSTSGTQVWYATRDVPATPGGPAALTKHTYKTWSEIETLLPSAKLLYFGLNQGAGNSGADNTADKVTLCGRGYSLLHAWRAPATSPTPTAPTPTAPTPTASASASAPATPSMAPVAATLPVTGAGTTALLIGGVVLVGGGAVLYLVGRRRRTNLEFVNDDGPN